MLTRVITLFAAITALALLGSNCGEDDCTCPDPADRPRVVSTYPEPDSTDIPTDTFLTAIFSERLDPATISAGAFTLTGPSGPITAGVNYDGLYTVTMTPYGRLPGHSILTARIDEGVRALTGPSLGAPYAWSFTTGTTPLWLIPDLEFTIRDNNGDGSPDEFVGGGPPGRFLQSGVDGSRADRAIMEFPLDHIEHDRVLEAYAFVVVDSSTVEGGIARIESWGYIGNGSGELADWDLGSLTLAMDDQPLRKNQTLALPIIDFINAALASSASHVGLRFVVTGQPVVQLVASTGFYDEDAPRILIHY